MSAGPTAGGYWHEANALLTHGNAQRFYKKKWSKTKNDTITLTCNLFQARLLKGPYLITTPKQSSDRK